MAAAATDLFRESAPLFQTTLEAAMLATDTAATLASVVGIPTNTGVTITVDQFNATGTPTPTLREVMTGVVSGSQIIDLIRGQDGTTAQAHASGAIVQMVFTSQANNDFMNGILAQHNQDGSHSSAFTVPAGTITGSELANGTITGTQIAANTVTGNNLVGLNLFGVGAGYVGTVPAAKTGQFYMQTATDVVTFNAESVATITFPVAFPNGLVSVFLTSGDSGAAFHYIAIASTASATSVGVVGYTGTTGIGAATVRVNWLAIGF